MVGQLRFVQHLYLTTALHPWIRLQQLRFIDRPFSGFYIRSLFSSCAEGKPRGVNGCEQQKAAYLHKETHGEPAAFAFILFLSF